MSDNDNRTPEGRQRLDDMVTRLRRGTEGSAELEIDRLRAAVTKLEREKGDIARTIAQRIGQWARQEPNPVAESAVIGVAKRVTREFVR